MQAIGTLTIMAARRTAWEQLQQVPAQTWLNLLICAVAAVLIARLWRTLRALNDYAPWMAAGIVASFILFYWTYNRTEPRFLTPVVEPLTHFLPTRAQHDQALDNLRRTRDP